MMGYGRLAALSGRQAIVGRERACSHGCAEGFVQKMAIVLYVRVKCVTFLGDGRPFDLELRNARMGTGRRGELL